MFLRFALVTALSRVSLKRQGRRVGRRAAEHLAYAASAVWILCSLAMVAAAKRHLLDGDSA